MFSESSLLNQPVVIDNGTGIIKAGFAGDDIPKTTFPSYVGRPKHIRMMAGAVEGNTFIGRRAQELRGLLRVKWPIEHGIVTDWEDMERIWQHVYTNELKTQSEEHPVLLTTPPLNPRKNAEKAAQVLFETFNVPSLGMSLQGVLALYASGRTTGVVVDVGDGVPVYEGFVVTGGIKRADVAGRDVTNHLALLLRKAGTVLETSAELEIVRLIKEKTCYVALSPSKAEKEGVPDTEFVLPDGNIVKIGKERFRAPEILFNPEVIGSESPGVHAILSEAIQRVDCDLRRVLYGNIVLSGGSTLTRGFGDRLLSEVKRVAVKDVKIKIFAPPERKYSTWIGGSILASLSTFKKMWVTSEEYAEDPGVIHRRFMN